MNEYNLNWSDINKFGNGHIIDHLVNPNNYNNLDMKDSVILDEIKNEIKVDYTEFNQSFKVESNFYFEYILTIK